MSQVLGAILAIRVQVTGANSVTSTLNNVRRVVNDTGKGIQDTTESLKQSTAAAAAWGTALLTAGIGIGTSAVKAYEDVEKTRRSFVALIGSVQGNALSEWLSRFGLEANASTEALRSAAQKWLSVGGGVGNVRSLITGLEGLSSLGKSNAELERTAKAIADIQSKKVFQGEELRQLTNAGVNLDAVAKNLGLDNIRKAIGKSASKVVPAILTALNSLPKQAPLLFQSLRNEVEHLQLALVPTGQLITMAFTPIIWLGSKAISVFETINKLTFGFAGAAISVGLMISGVSRLLPLVSKLIDFEKMWAYWQGVVNVLNNPLLTLGPTIRYITETMKDLVYVLKARATWDAIIAVLEGNWVAIGALLAVGVGVLAGWEDLRDIFKDIADIWGMISGTIGGWIAALGPLGDVLRGIAQAVADILNPFVALKNLIESFFPELRDKRAEERAAANGSGSASGADRPMKRSSVQNLWMDQMGKSFG